GTYIESAGPSTPVLITGLDEVPSAGDPFQVVHSEKYAREISQKRKELKKANIVKNLQRITLDNLYEHIKKGKIKELKIVLKADVDGSVEVIKNSLEKLSNDEVAVKIIHAVTGDITESDILLAAASNAIIIGFHIRLNRGLEDFAKKEGVSIQLYRIIYDAIDDVKKALEGLLEPLIREEGRGILEVKQVFKITKVGNVLGCFVKEGKVFNTDYVKVIREENIIFNGKILSLKRFKDEVKEVSKGMECGIYIGEEFKDVKEGDILESYSITKLKRTL
ncbi:MAG: translation initiation factor IF-2, partial [bacterium]|nr:translation initiation factor IF-2 [bacterium]